MKRILVSVAMLALLAGCAGSTATKATNSVAIACDSYQTLLVQATALKKNGKLTAKQVSTIDSLNKATDVVCLPNSPIDPAAATGVVESAITVIKGIIQ